jgi:ABC-type branched-subunit amino acid transport system ATPase component
MAFGRKKKRDEATADTGADIDVDAGELEGESSPAGEPAPVAHVDEPPTREIALEEAAENDVRAGFSTYAADVVDSHLLTDPREAYFATRGASMSFGGLKAVNDVSITVEKGEIVGIIGPNGAGKTTLFDCISGYLTMTGGHIWFKGTDVTGERPFNRAWRGIGRTFQTATLFPNLTVYDNVRIACHRNMKVGFWRNLFGTTSSSREELAVSEQVTEIIERMGLTDYAPKVVADLSYGTVRITELACLLAIQPELILLDEPAAGIAQKEVEVLGPLLKKLQGELGATFLFIEHDMPLVMSLSDRIYAMAAGQVIAQGTPEEIQHNPAVLESYLGTHYEEITNAQ